MSRSSRMILIVGAFAVVAVAVLALMANRYNRLLSVREVAPDKGASAPAAPQSTTPAVSEPEPAAGETPSTAPVDPGVSKEIETFIAARQALKKVLDTEPAVAAAFVRELEGKSKKVSNFMTNADFLIELRLKKEHAIQSGGMTVERYRAIRSAYREWKDGKPASDAGLAAALESHRDALKGADLGSYEPLDF
jgi:hypothetical protein